MPADDTLWRNLKRMHVWFAISCVALLAVTIWMLAVDHRDEWRAHARTVDRIQDLRFQRELARENAISDRERIEAIFASLDDLREPGLVEELREQYQTHEAERPGTYVDKVQNLIDWVAEHRTDQQRLQQLQNEMAEAARREDLLARRVRLERAERDKARADYDLSVARNASAAEQQRLKAIFDREQDEVDRAELEHQQALTRLNELRAEHAQKTRVRDALRAALDRELAEANRIDEARQQVAPDDWFSSAKRRVMQWPIIDGFNSPHKVDQIWLPELKQTLGMARTDRYDRCRTCHQLIDEVEAGNVPAFPHGHPTSNDPADWVAAGAFPHPYATHPRPDLYLTASSPHPVETFGCTGCHEGQGSGTSFSNAEHTPNDPHIDQLWYRQYGYHANHFWEYPMLPERFRESSCIRCHHNVVELGVHPRFEASAPKAHRGYQLITEYGCFGCHEIHGFDAGRSIGPDLRLEPATEEERRAAAEDPNLIPGKMRKVGPSLRHIATKTTPEWVEHWTEEPKRFRPTTRMPQFFKLANQVDWDSPQTQAKLAAHSPLDLVDDADPVAARFQPVELAGIAQYLFDKSQPMRDALPEHDLSQLAGHEPDATRGGQLFATRGCLACHSHRDFPDVTADFGPDLSDIHAKLPHAADDLLGSSGFEWLYGWVLDPERYHPRTKMPNLYLAPADAADIAAYLLSGPPAEYQSVYARQPDLGLRVADVNQAAAERAGLERPAGARIVSVLAGSAATRTTQTPDAERQDRPAARTVVPLREGDIITRYAGTAVRNAAHFNQLVPAATPGDRVPLAVRRGRTDLDLTITISDPLDDLVWLYLLKTQAFDKVDAALTPGGRYDLAGSADVRGDEIELVFSGEVVQPLSPTQLLVQFDHGQAPHGADAELIWSSGRNRNLAFPIGRFQPDRQQPGFGTLVLERSLSFAAAPGDRFVLSGPITDEMKLNYVGRRTISQYGCFGCHDIPGFETARPIGTTLQDWGRKDQSLLALEHIEEFLHHHGEPDGSSTHDRAVTAMKKAQAGGLARGEFTSPDDAESEMAAAFYVNAIAHHGRAGFLWQKLREPRSYDYKKTELKGYDERLRMPRFTFDPDLRENEAAIEAIATFVLGLVADPPSERYLYRPTGPAADRLEGERLLEKYNCVGCHAIDLPKVRYGIEPEIAGVHRGLADLVGMTRDELIQWFLQNKGQILEASRQDPKVEQAVAIPDPVRLVLENVTDILTPVDLKSLAADSDQPDVLAQQFPWLDDEELSTLREQLPEWSRAAAERAELPEVPAGQQPSPRHQELENQLAAARQAVSGPILANGLRMWLVELARLADRDRQGQALSEWFRQHREVLIANRFLPGEYPDGLRLLLDLRPPRTVSTRERFLSATDFGKWLVLLTEIESQLRETPEPEDDELREQAERLTRQREQLRDAGVSMARIRRLARQLAEAGDIDELVHPEPGAEQEPEQRAARRELLAFHAEYEQPLQAVLGQPVVDFHGLLFQGANPQLLDYEQVLSYHLWETLDVGGRILLPGGLPVPMLRIVEETPGRGGDFAHWLVGRLIAERGGKAAGDRGRAWQMVPPPLYQEGVKVQTPWLYRFLKNPHLLRYESVLRMPQFNLDDDEALALANYFAAAEGAAYPYQAVPQREPQYLAHQNRELAELKGEDRANYLDEGWAVLNGNLCMQCHSVGTREFTAGADPTQIRGPDLGGVYDRLRPDWLQLWLMKPPWITPYTSMPVNFPHDQVLYPHLLGGEGQRQITALRDALLNYREIMEQIARESQTGQAANRPQQQ